MKGSRDYLIKKFCHAIEHEISFVPNYKKSLAAPKNQL